MQHSTIGGSRDTELNAFAVMPWQWSPPAVSTVMPVAELDITSRSAAAEGTGERWRCSVTSASGVRRGLRRGEGGQRLQQLGRDARRHRVVVGAPHAGYALLSPCYQAFLTVLGDLHVVEAE